MKATLRKRKFEKYAPCGMNEIIGSPCHGELRHARELAILAFHVDELDLPLRPEFESRMVRARPYVLGMVGNSEGDCRRRESR